MEVQWWWFYYYINDWTNRVLEFSSELYTQKKATVDVFMVLGDRLFEGKGNTLLIPYLSKLYPNCSDLEMDPICHELQNDASIQNYKLICQQ